jgi:hypothetical protein
MERQGVKKIVGGAKNNTLLGETFFNAFVFLTSIPSFF